MVEDSGFRYKVTVDKGLGIFHRSDADCAINIGDNTEREIAKNTKGMCTSGKKYKTTKRCKQNLVKGSDSQP